MDSTPSRLITVGLTAGVIGALTLPGSAAATNHDPAMDPPTGIPAEMIAALERDLDVTAAEAADRLTADSVASDTEQELRTTLDDAFGGAWVNDDRQLVVGITDLGHADTVAAAGAQAELVGHTEAELAEIMTTMDQAAAPAAAEVYGWYVDVATNSVVVTAAPGAADAAHDFVTEHGLAGRHEFTNESDADAVPVRVEESATGAPVTYQDIIGGHPYYFGQSRCSIGFSVQPAGFVTAGHCGPVGTSTQGHNGAAQGVVTESNFPGADAGYVSVNANWTPQPYVWAYSGNQVYLVQGSQPASVGADVCRSGYTTGWRCGTITALNQTVNYPEGTVTGLTATSACAEPGDSGGSFVAANGQAQGVTSGGSGTCASGGETFFQPLNPMLTSYGLTLVTG